MKVSDNCAELDIKLIFRVLLLQPCTCAYVGVFQSGIYRLHFLLLPKVVHSYHFEVEVVKHSTSVHTHKYKCIFEHMFTVNTY
jgi:hypothetical protein